MNYIPDEVKEIVNEQIKMIESTLPYFLEGYYIYGSVSLGAFDYGLSDIDFIITTQRKATPKDINILKKFIVISRENLKGQL